MIDTSKAIAKEMERIYGKNTKVVNVRMYHEGTARKYVMGIEEAHKKAATSKCKFK